MPNGLGFVNGYFFNPIACLNLIDYLQAFYYLAKAGVVAVEVLGVLAVVADKKL